MSLTPEQQQNANAIIAAGKARGESDANITVAIMVALTESGLRNLNYGDRDSLGLFQQRASWGTAAQRTNPTWSANKFFDALDANPNNSLSPWLRAQKVQVSAFSDGSNYKAQYQVAQQITGHSGVTTSTPIVSTASTKTDIAGKLLGSGFWIRLGLGTLGATLLIIASIKILDDNGVDAVTPIKDVVKNARS